MIPPFGEYERIWTYDTEKDLDIAFDSVGEEQAKAMFHEVSKQEILVR